MSDPTQETPGSPGSRRPSPPPIREFNDRGTLWLLEDPFNLRDLLRILEPDLVDRLDFSRARREEGHLRDLLVEEARQSRFREREEVIAMGMSIIEQAEARGRAEGQPPPPLKGRGL